MANYELKIDLVGGEKVEALLSKLGGLSGALGQGGSSGGSGGASRDVSDIARSMASGAQSTAKMRSDLDKISSMGKGSGANFLKGAMGSKSASFWKNNPELAGLLNPEKSDAAQEAGKKFAKGVYWTSKSMLSGQVPAMPQWLKNIDLTKPFGTKSFGGGIAGTPHEDAFAKFEREHGDMFGSNLDWKLREMRRKSDAAFNKQQKETPGEMQGPDLSGALRRAHEKSQKDAITFKKDMSFLMMPLFNPGSMWATMFSGRQTFSAMNTEHGAAFRGKFMGGMGAAGATGILVGAATAIGLALKALTITVKETMAAYEHARQLYAKSLMSGMGLQWQSKRSNLAAIMGVSEQDIFRFGAQMAYLNPKIEEASKILAQTATPLTAVSWQFKILQLDLSALFSKLAADAAPAVIEFVNALDVLVNFLTKHSKQIENIAIGASPIGLIAKWDAWVLSKLSGNAGKKAIDSMPSPQAWMKQMQASSWEKMGLVVGGGHQNYAQQTAKNTREAVKYLSEISRKMAGTAAAPFGMLPMTNNP